MKSIIFKCRSLRNVKNVLSARGWMDPKGVVVGRRDEGMGRSANSVKCYLARHDASGWDKRSPHFQAFE